MYNNYYAINTYDDRYLAHHGILGQKWGVRKYQNEDGTLTEAGKQRYRAYAYGDMYFNAKKHSANKGTKASVFLGAAMPIVLMGPSAVLGAISVPTLLASAGTGAVLSGLSSQVSRGVYFVLQKMNESGTNRFTRKLEKDRIKNGVQ
ncbi:MAG: hypothetical protein BZ133_08400 [Methanosphaera sp. SHI613]|nr:MAG: hypothetical protein BZ133_08400 [Methanosphaera sp. SHI613]